MCNFTNDTPQKIGDTCHGHDDDDDDDDDDAFSSWCELCQQDSFFSNKTPYGTCQCS
jgi:hypothetical protein